MKKGILFITIMFVVLLTACDGITETHTVTYELDGGTITNIEGVVTEVNSGNAIAEPIIEKEGNILLGWYSDSTFNTLYDFTQPVVGDLTIYALWSPIEIRVIYDDGTYTEIVTVEFGGDYSLEEDPTREGYTFGGWFLDEEFTLDLESATITEDTFVYAKWTVNEYVVTFYALGEVAYQETYEFGEIIEIPEDYEVGDNTYYGTYLSEEYLFQIEQGVTMPAEDIDLYFRLATYQSSLSIYFVPSRPADEILNITEPLENLLIDELQELGYSISEIDIFVGSTYEMVGEALQSGLADIAYLPGGTYVMFKDMQDSPIDVILAATRAGLSKDSDNPADWNDGSPTLVDPETLVPYYRGLLIAGTSAAARTLADKVNNGDTLVWDDVKDLNFCVRSATSSSGYIYPSLWLQEMFGKTFDDVEGTVTQTGGYGDTMASLATGTCDVGALYGDARMHYADSWTNDYGRTQSIWDETDVIGVTPKIMNDTISISRVNLEQDLINAIQQAFINLAETSEGLDVMSIYSHQGYVEVTDEDYDSARDAYNFMQ